MQVQPLLRETYSEKHLRSFRVVDQLAALSADDWSGYRETVVQPNRDTIARLARMPLPCASGDGTRRDRPTNHEIHERRIHELRKTEVMNANAQSFAG